MPLASLEELTERPRPMLDSNAIRSAGDMFANQIEKHLRDKATEFDAARRKHGMPPKDDSGTELETAINTARAGVVILANFFANVNDIAFVMLDRQQRDRY